MPIVFSVPETIVVHLGTPDDTTAGNVTVPFIDYIKNVASSEIYPTWPESAIRANILAQISFALNRIFTEHYRVQGYNFDITNNTQFDQAFVYGRSIFDNISQIVDEIFNDYIVRQGDITPLFARYCDGRTSSCPGGLSQWGSVSLAEEGFTPYRILTSYYGDISLVEDAPVANLGESRRASQAGCCDGKWQNPHRRWLPPVRCPEIHSWSGSKRRRKQPRSKRRSASQ